MSEAYKRVERVQEQIPVNEIRVKKDFTVGRYLNRAHDLLTGKIEGQDTVVIKGMDRAMDVALKLAELVKHKVANIHQLNEIINVKITDEFEPLEEGLDHLSFSRNIAMLSITLSKQELDTNKVGYQEPIDEKNVEAFQSREDYRPPRRSQSSYRPRESGNNRSFENGSSRGRGGFRGNYRGGFRGNQRGGLRAGFRGNRGNRVGQEGRPQRERSEGRRNDYRGRQSFDEPQRQSYGRGGARTYQDDYERPQRAFRGQNYHNQEQRNGDRYPRRQSDSYQYQDNDNQQRNETQRQPRNENYRPPRYDNDRPKYDNDRPRYDNDRPRSGDKRQQPRRQQYDNYGEDKQPFRGRPRLQYRDEERPYRGNRGTPYPGNRGAAQKEEGHSQSRGRGNFGNNRNDY